MSTNVSYALITGASMGIGRSLALECAGRGMNVLLVALEEELLAQLASEIRERYQVEADYLQANLTGLEGTRKVWEWCNAHHYQVNMLLSNAGMGVSGIYENNPLDKYRTLVLLNNMAAVELTHYFLPMLKSQEEAYLMYTSSMEATIPVPYKAVYSGSKHFLHGFSLALGEELREFGIHVSLLCPGPVLTHAGAKARLESQGKAARLLVLSPEEVARAALDGLLGKQRVIVPGLVPSFIMGLLSWIPRRLKMAISFGIFRKYKDVQG